MFRGVDAMETLEIDRTAEGIVTVTLNRPARKNAISPAMFGELRRTFRALGADGEVRAVVLTGAGGEFCSGADLGDTDTGMHVLPWMRSVGECCTALHAMPQPVVAR